MKGDLFMSYQLGKKKQEAYQTLLSDSVSELRLKMMQARIQKKLGQSGEKNEKMLPSRVFRATIARILTQKRSSAIQQSIQASKKANRLHKKPNQ